MKKQFLLAALIILIGVCFCQLNDNSLKACCKNIEACSAVKTKIEVNNIPAGGFAEDEDASFNIFINPFTRL